MSDPKVPLKRKSTLKAITLVGVLLVIAGVGLWLYTESIIRGHKQILNDPNLTLEQQWDWEGSLQWWTTAKMATYDPLSIILVTIGICALEYALIYIIVQA